MNKEQPEESTEQRLILKNPKFGSVASGLAVIRKMVLLQELEEFLKTQ